MADVTRQLLRNYLDDALPDADTAAVEKALRDDPAVRALFDQVRQEVDRGEHSVGAVWRRERLTCPTRDQLGSFLLDALDPGLTDYIRFHLDVVGCPVCRANRDDLEGLAAAPSPGGPPPDVRGRRAKLAESTAAALPGGGAARS